MLENQRQLWDAACSTGNYPNGTTAKDLANCMDADSTTALHMAALRKNLPPRTTAKQLAQCQDKHGWSALHNAANVGHLPRGTTTELLKTTKSKNNTTAWDLLCALARNHPLTALTLSPAWFQDDRDFAIAIVAQATKYAPEFKNAAAIWLGHVLANTTP